MRRELKFLHESFDCDLTEGFWSHRFNRYIFFHYDKKSYLHIHYQSLLSSGRSFAANSRTKAAVLPKGRSSTANSGTKTAVSLGMNRCGSFPLLSAPLSSLASERSLKDLKRSQGSHHGGEESGFDLLGPLDLTDIHHRV